MTTPVTTASTPIETLVRDNPELHRYELYAGDELAGYLAYRRAEDQVLITSTVVQPQHRGHGLAGELVEAALDDLRGQGCSVRTTCWYVKEWLDSHPDPSRAAGA